MKHLLTLLFTLIAACGHAQTNLYVDSSVSASGAGTAWASAYKTLNEALSTANAAGSGNYVISIAKGTYYPTGIRSGTNRDSTFLIRRGGISLLGGYPTGGGTRNPYIFNTVLSGNIGTDSTPADNSYHVMVIAGIAAGPDTVFLDGLTIREGRADGAGSNFYNSTSVLQGNAGAIAVKNVACRLIVSTCRFLSNTSSGFAGAIQNEAALSRYANCTFMDNHAAGSGGAMFINSDSLAAPVIIDSCSFMANTSTAGSGGAVFNTRTAATGAGTIFSFTYFSVNMAAGTGPGIGQGGAVCDQGQGAAASTFYRCNFSSNSAGYGGAIAANNTAVAAGPFYIRGCNFNRNVAFAAGGAIHAVSSGFGFTIDSTSFVANNAGNTGGGLHSLTTGAGVAGNVRQCLFQADSAVIGGGVYNHGPLNLSYCRFIDNAAAQYGGAMYNVSPGNSTLSYTIFSGNRSRGYGGALCNMNAGTGYAIGNSIFSGNYAAASGGGIFDSAAAPAITNCTFAGDTALTGNGIANWHNSSPIITNSIIWDGTGGIDNFNGSAPLITYSTIQGGYYPGTGNLSSDPLFMAPAARSAAPTTAGDYTLIPCSPAVNAGNNSGSYTGVKDLAGNPRLYGAAVDQGAYEYAGAAFPPPIAGRDTICAGGSIQLSNPTSLGTWASSNPAVATISSTGLVTTHAAGVDTITYTISAGACSAVLRKAITVVPVPVLGPITGSDSVCSGSIVHFTITVSTTVTAAVNWTSANNLIAYPAYPYNKANFVGGLPGTTLIQCTATTIAGCSVSAFKNLTVLALPRPGLINASNHYCLHDTATLSDSTAGGIWSSSDTNKVRIDAGTGFLRVVDTGIVILYYTVTDSLGCSGSVSKTISIDPVNTGVSLFGSGLIADDAGAAYQWLDCDMGLQPIPGENGQAFIPAVNGRYAVAVTRGSCTDTSACHSITGLGISGPKGGRGFRIFPNPSEGLINITSPEPGVFRLHDMTGRIALSVAVPNAGTSAITGARNLPAGIYRFSFTGASGRHSSGKLVVER
jgi:predicted outer membrane repeat protein